MQVRLLAVLRDMLLTAAWSYIAGMLLWLALYALHGDRWWWLFLLTSVACHLFLPVLLLPPLALLTRQHLLWVGIGVLAGVWLGWFGQLYLPHTGTVQAQSPPLSVMTYNVLYHNHEVERTLATMRASNADVVAIQELNDELMQALHHDLIDRYPYQLVAPDERTAGMGIISRYPLESLRASSLVDLAPEGWVGAPQLARLEFQGRAILLLNIHAASTNLGYGGPLRLDPAQITASVRRRETQMHALAAFARSHAEPLLVLGDFNTGYPSHAHRIVSGVLHDAWLTAGSGYGHTFPGADIPGSSRPTVLGQPIPQWLIRLDYIFYSEHWQASHAWLPPWDERSDHRAVQAELYLR